MVSTKLFLTYNELLQPLGKMLEFAKCILEGVVLGGSWSIMWRVLIKLTPLNWRWWMIISFSASVTGINTLLSKKFAWKINDLSTENLLDPVFNYTAVITCGQNCVDVLQFYRFGFLGVHYLGASLYWKVTLSTVRKQEASASWRLSMY